MGVDRVFIDGSFVSSKSDPGDIDGYFECEWGRYTQILIGLLHLEPSLPWDVTHRPPDPKSRERKPMMWHRYRVELFPHFPDNPIPTGIYDEFGNSLLFPSLFRRDRATSRQKSIIQIIRE